MSMMARLCLGICLFAAVIVGANCAADAQTEKLRKPHPSQTRIQHAFEKTKAVCFGRFIIDIPESARVVWGAALVPLDIDIYPGEMNKIKGMQEKFINELKAEKAINQNDVPLLISVDDVKQPLGRIVTGYENFESINNFQMRGYFGLNGSGLVIQANPMREDKDRAIAEIISIARRLRQHPLYEIPKEPGNCIEHAFLPDKPGLDENHFFEHIRFGFRLKDIPDAHFSIYVAPANPYDQEGDSLKRKFDRIKNDPMTPEEAKALASIKFLRESPRAIGEWKTGYEVLMHAPDEEGSRSHHDFQAKFVGVPHDPYRPYADIQFQTGVDDNVAGATKASLTDEEAIAVWDKITSSIRIRPNELVKTAGSVESL